MQKYLWVQRQKKNEEEEVEKKERTNPENVFHSRILSLFSNRISIVEHVKFVCICVYRTMFMRVFVTRLLDHTLKQFYFIFFLHLCLFHME